MHLHNGIKTVLLLGALSVLLVAGGSAFGGRQGLYFGLGFAVLTNFFSYFFSDKLALMMSGAQPLTEQENPEIYRRIAPLVQSLCTAHAIADAEAVHHA